MNKIQCPQCNGQGSYIVGKLYPTGHGESNEECDFCDGTGEVETQ